LKGSDEVPFSLNWVIDKLSLSRLKARPQKIAKRIA
jgi:hypothetical protein